MIWWFAQTSIVVAALSASAWGLGRFGRLGPAARHTLWVIVLARMVTPPLLHWPWALPGPARPAPAGAATEPMGGVPSGEPPRRAVTPVPEVGAVVPGGVAGPSTPGHRPAGPDPGPAVTGGGTGGVRAPSPAWWPVAGRAAVSVWLAGAGALAGYQLIRIARFGRRLRGASLAPEGLAEEVGRLARAEGLRPPGVAVLGGVDSPMLWCGGRVLLVVPERLFERLDGPMRRCVIVHELAHLARRDHWVARLSLAAGWLWWWNPLYWWVCRRLGVEAELACDARVVSRFPGDRRAYAEALLDVCQGPSAGGRPGPSSPSPTPALGIGGGPSRLFERRLRMILQGPVSRPLPPRALLAAGLLALIGLPAWTRDDPGPTPAGPAPEARGQARSFADLDAVIQHAPTGRLLIGGAPGAAALVGGDADHPGPATSDPGPVEGPGLDRLPVLDPGPGGDDTLPCLDPPSEAEIWAKLPATRRKPGMAKVERKNARFVVEKIGQRVDPCKNYPMAGRCELVHCHYKCTVFFDEVSSSDYPIPMSHSEPRVEVVYIDKDYLRRCDDHGPGTEADAGGPTWAIRSIRLADEPGESSMVVDGGEFRADRIEMLAEEGRFRFDGLQMFSRPAGEGDEFPCFDLRADRATVVLDGPYNFFGRGPRRVVRIEAEGSVRMRSVSGSGPGVEDETMVDAERLRLEFKPGEPLPVGVWAMEAGRVSTRAEAGDRRGSNTAPMEDPPPTPARAPDGWYVRADDLARSTFGPGHWTGAKRFSYGTGDCSAFVYGDEARDLGGGRYELEPAALILRTRDVRPPTVITGDHAEVRFERSIAEGLAESDPPDLQSAIVRGDVRVGYGDMTVRGSRLVLEGGTVHLEGEVTFESPSSQATRRGR